MSPSPRCTVFFVILVLVASGLATAQTPASTAKPTLLPPGVHPLPVCDRVMEIDAILRRQDWAAAESKARAAITEELQTRESAFAALVGQLAVAEAGQGRDEEARWHWQLAMAMGVRAGLGRYGATGERVEKISRRHVDEAPPGMLVRRPGDGGATLTPARKVSGSATLPGTWRTFPRGIQVQLVVDTKGRVVQPVVRDCTFSALTYVVVEAMRDWQFVAAQAGGEAVASFYEFSQPEVEPLEQVVDFGSGPLGAPLQSLKAGRYDEAAAQLDKLWTGALNDAEQKRAFLGVALALRALAAAGKGNENQAICRYQAAQTLEPRLYGADLAAFGAPGALLARHPWRAPQGECLAMGADGDSSATGAKAQKPQALVHREPIFPEYARHLGVEGRVVVESIIDETGALRDVLLKQPSALAGLDAAALDALCDWTFKPATLNDKPIKVFYQLAVNFALQHHH
jgi:TonB family protein